MPKSTQNQCDMFDLCAQFMDKTMMLHKTRRWGRFATRHQHRGHQVVKRMLAATGGGK